MKSIRLQKLVSFLSTFVAYSSIESHVGDNVSGLEYEEYSYSGAKPSQVKVLSSVWWGSQPFNVAKKGNQKVSVFQSIMALELSQQNMT